MEKKAQEEMIGFALILIIIAVIFLIVISFSFNKNSTPAEDPKAQAFLTAMLQTTTPCQDFRLKKLEVLDLIFACQRNQECFSGINSCQILNETLNNILRNTWNTSKQIPEKGIMLNISSQEQIFGYLSGNLTKNYIGSTNQLAKSSTQIEISITMFY